VHSKAGNNTSQQPAPPDGPDSIVVPSGTCCARVDHSLRLDQATPFGASVDERSEGLRTLSCPLRLADGSSESALVSVANPHDVVFKEGRPNDASCQLCYSDLRFGAALTITVESRGISLSGPAVMRELEAGDGFNFELQSGDLKANGLLAGHEPSLRIERVSVQGTTLVAETTGRCTSAPRGPF